jgi:hypothetical protein
MPIVVGSPRSGTTLLRLILDSHPQLAIPPETWFLPAAQKLTGSGEALREELFQFVVSYPASAPAWDDFQIPAEDFHARLQEIEPFSIAEGFRLFYRMYAERFGKPRWGDKTPLYCRHLPYLQELLPEARFVHIVRDGRDAAVSLRERWFSPGFDIETQANHWRDNVAAARAGGAVCQHFLEVRFEDLVQQPESTVRRICGFIDLDYHPAMLEYPERAPSRLEEHRTRYRTDGSVLVSQEERLRQSAHTRQPPDAEKVGIWRRILSDEENRRFEEIAGDLLATYGYPLSPQIDENLPEA